MNIDFSLFENIDFKDPDNLLFLIIVSITAVILIAISVIILFVVIKAIKKMLAKTFNINKVKVQSSKAGTANFQNIDGASPRQRVMGGDMVNNFSINANDSEEESEKVDDQEKYKLPSSKHQEKSVEGNVVSKKPTVDSNFKLGDKKMEGKNNVQESYKEKEAKSIAESLGKLRANQDRGKDTVESKMPSRGPKVEDLSHQPIKINRPKDFSKDDDIDKNGVRNDGLVGGAGKKDIFGKEIKKKHIYDTKGSAPKVDENKGSAPKVEENKVSAPKKAVSKKSLKNKDASIFEGKQEIPRTKLRHKLRYDPKIYEAQKEAGLYNFDRATRERLEKEVFAPVYGRNISKTDLNQSIKKLGKKMLDAKTPAEHAKIRKEIKFFRKIGGIKK